MTLVHTILIIDDDIEDQEFIRDALEAVDPTVKRYFANCCDAALKILSSPSKPLPDLIFLDLNMPRMNGRECLIKIKEKSIINTIPVIVLSTHKTTEEEEEMKQLGATAYFKKPHKFEKLCGIISHVLSKNLSFK